MKAVVLAGGFAKRLWPLTKDTPKPLLPVAGKPMIDYIMERLESIDDIDSVIVSINARFEPHFREWASGRSFSKSVEIFTEPSMNEDEKLGAIGALGFMLREKNVQDDLLVIAGDNLFDFDINGMLSNGNGSKAMVALYDMNDHEKVRNRYGVVLLGEGNVIKEFHEKPENPPSTLVSTGCYFFSAEAVEMIHNYLSNGNNPDAPGFFVSWLAGQTDVHGFVFDGDSRWFDIGSIESYQEANALYSGEPS